MSDGGESYRANLEMLGRSEDDNALAGFIQDLGESPRVFSGSQVALYHFPLTSFSFSCNGRTLRAANFYFDTDQKRSRSFSEAIVQGVVSSDSREDVRRKIAIAPFRSVEVGGDYWDSYELESRFVVSFVFKVASGRLQCATVQRLEEPTQSDQKLHIVPTKWD